MLLHFLVKTLQYIAEPVKLLLPSQLPELHEELFKNKLLCMLAAELI